MTAHEIRKAYPHPVSPKVLASREFLYCVGGALGAALGRRIGFPWPSTLAEWLQEANPALTWGDALLYAVKIVKASDREEFEAAWAYLADALRGAEEKGGTS